jgi:hypothetical protein
LIMLRKRLELSWLNESNRVKNSVNSSAT